MKGIHCFAPSQSPEPKVCSSLIASGPAELSDITLIRWELSFSSQLFLQFADLFVVVVVQGGLCGSRKHQAPSKEKMIPSALKDSKRIFCFLPSQNRCLNVIQVFQCENQSDARMTNSTHRSSPSQNSSFKAGVDVQSAQDVEFWTAEFSTFTHQQEEFNCKQQGPIPSKLPKIFLLELFDFCFL